MHWLTLNMLPAGGMLGSTLNRFDVYIRYYHSSPILTLLFTCPSLQSLCIAGLSNGYQQFSTSFSVASGGTFRQWGSREFLAR